MPDDTATPAPTAVTPAIEWKRKARARWLVTLPSGNVMKCKRADWIRMTAAGIIDAQALAEFSTAADLNQEQMTLRMAKAIPMAQAVVRAIAVEPSIGEGENDIAIEDLDDTDLMALFVWALTRGGVATAVEVAGE